MQQREMMKIILEKMFEGWILTEKTIKENPDSNGITFDQCMSKICDGDEIVGNLLAIFSHWSNDIQAIAPYFGMCISRKDDGSLIIRKDVPPAPSEDYTKYYFDFEKFEWTEVPQDEDIDVSVN